MHTPYLSPAVRQPGDRQSRLAPCKNPTEQRVLTVDELARQFCVSKKTISRWRQRGLVSRRFLFGRRKRIGFLQSSVDRFAAANQNRIRRGAEFSQLTDEEHRQIIERARCLAQAGGLPANIIKQISQATGRCVETIRYTLRQFDQEHAEAAIFPYRYRPLSTEAKCEICAERRRGESVAALARRFCQSRAGIDRIVNEIRRAEIMGLPLDYIGNEQFDCRRLEKKEAKMAGPPPDSDSSAKKPRVPSGLPAYLASLYEVPLLTREQEGHLFRKMNYLKYKAGLLREKLDPNRPKCSLMDRIEKLYNESAATKNQIISANLRLVVSIAKRYIGPAGEFFELVSDGNISLIRAVEKFDVAQGNRFSTYASWAIMKNFSRTIPHALRHQGRFCTSDAEMFGTVVDSRSDPYVQESRQLQRESQVQEILKRLDERERQIVTSRFGLTGGEKPLTLQQLGVVLGVTKERVRQLQIRAITKLRRAANEDRIEAPA